MRGGRAAGLGVWEYGVWECGNQKINGLIKRRILSFKYAFAGLADLFHSQPNARIHAVLALAVVIAGFFFSLSTTEWCLILLAMALVFAAEAFNTAIEYLTDLVSPGHHPLAGKAKDAAAAGVLCIAIGAAAVGICVFLPRLIRLFAAF